MNAPQLYLRSTLPTHNAISPQPLKRPSYILVVEDDVSLRFTLAEWLRNLDYVVYEAASADEAKIILASAIVVDLVVTDVDMPGSMNGLDLVDYMRDTLPAMTAIVVSGNPATHRITREKNIPFFQKPYNFDALAAAISSFVAKKLMTQNND